MKSPTDAAERLSRMLIDEGFHDGARLPPERELAEKLDLTRAQLRRALARLEADKRVWRRRGKGTFVGGEPFDATQRCDMLVQSTNPAEIMAARMVLEPRLSGLAAMHATTGNIGAIRREIDRGAAATEPPEFERCDSAFHRAVAEAAHNKPLLAAFDVVDRLRDARIWGELKAESSTPERRARYIEDHRACLTAIERRRVRDAEVAMEAHLEVVQRDLFGGWHRQTG